MNAKLLTMAVVLLFVNDAHAMGRSRKSSAPAAPQVTLARPVRQVRLASVWTRPFVFPNGSQIDLHYDLDTMLRTAVADQGQFAPTDGTESVPCDIEVQIRAAVSTAEFNNTELGIRFGYTPTGDIGTWTGLQGQLSAKIGTLGMDFSLWQCTLGRCSAIASTYADHKTTQIDGSLEIDLGVITTGPGFVTNTKFGNALRKIMADGISKLAATARLNELTWKSQVKEVHPDQGTLIFDAGAAKRIQTNQQFTVYAVTPSTSECEVYRPVAHIRTTQTESLSSVAAIEELLDVRGIQVGDVVTVR